jgi:hypothetical protein
MRENSRSLLGALLLANATGVAAITNGVYHPYVNEGEREIEYGLVLRGSGDEQLSLQSASFAYAWTDRISTELYLLSEQPEHGGGRARAYELEVKWQLTEQGEYSSDWGLLLEAEAGRGGDQYEIAAGVLWEKELGRRWVAAANAILEYEFGADVGDEFETAFRGQLRYLRAPTLEPAVEIYLDDQDYAAGPALLGAWRLGVAKQLRWEFGVLFGIGHGTPDTSLRGSVEFEF